MGSNDNNLFVGFDFFAKQVERDPDNPTARNLGLTSDSTSTPTTTNIADNAPDPATHMGELNVRQGRVDEMQERMAEGIEAYPGHSAQESAKYQDPGDLTPEQMRELLQRQGLNSEQAAAYVAALQQQQSEYSPLEELTGNEARFNAKREAGELTGNFQTNLTREAQMSSSADDNGGAFGKSHDEMMTYLNQAIGFMEKQQVSRNIAQAVPEATVEGLEESWGEPNVYEPDESELNQAQQNAVAAQKKRDEALDTEEPAWTPESEDSFMDSGDGFIKALGALIDGMESR